MNEINNFIEFFKNRILNDVIDDQIEFSAQSRQAVTEILEAAKKNRTDESEEEKQRKIRNVEYSILKNLYYI